MIFDAKTQMPTATLSWRDSLDLLGASESPLSQAGKLVCQNIIENGRVFPHVFTSGEQPKMILDVTGFLNHRVEPKLIEMIGRELSYQLRGFWPELILTAAASGNIPAYALARSLGDIPVIYAKKGAPVTFQNGVFQAKSHSFTSGQSVDLVVSSDCLAAGKRIVIADDFLNTAKTSQDLSEIARQANGQVVGMGFIIEKSFSGGREQLVQSGFASEQIVSLVDLEAMEPGKIKVKEIPHWLSLKRT